MLDQISHRRHKYAWLHVCALAFFLRWVHEDFNKALLQNSNQNFLEFSLGFIEISLDKIGSLSGR